MHSLTPERLTLILAQSEVQSLSVDARKRLEWIAACVIDGASVSDVCAKYNIARSTLHRWIKRFNPDDLSTLEEQAHVAHTLRTSTLEQSTIDLIRSYRQKSPLMGKEKIRVLLMQEHGIDVSSSSIGRAIEREGLYFAATPLHWKKRVSYKTQTATPVQTTDAVRNQKSEIRNTAEEKTEISHLKSDISDSCACFWCSFWKSHSRGIRRSLALASVAVNIAIASLYMATAMWESGNSEMLRADITPSTVSSLDGR
jgi:transposase-like protein